MNQELRLAATYDALPRWTSALRERLRACARRIDAWLETRRRVGRDRALLAGMSDRELRDIGLDRGSVDAVADGRWLRERAG